MFDNLSYNREPWTIRRDLTKANVEARDGLACFVGADAYTQAGGTIVRDLFTEDRGGYFEDAALLDRLVIAKLEDIVAEVQASEGWKWVSAHIDYPYAYGMRRSYRIRRSCLRKMPPPVTPRAHRPGDRQPALSHDASSGAVPRQRRRARIPAGMEAASVTRESELIDSGSDHSLVRGKAVSSLLPARPSGRRCAQ